MSCCVFFRRCSLCRGLANTAMHLTRPLQFRAAQQDPEPAAFCVQVMASVRRTDEGGWGSHGNAPKRRVFDAQGISPTKVEQIHEGVALLLLIAAAGADGAEKSIAGASGGLPAARCTSCNPHRRQGPGIAPPNGPSSPLSRWQGTRSRKPEVRCQEHAPTGADQPKALAGAAHRCS